ncbi:MULTISPECIES: hypothetical protein [unclassified Candidatus Frackibacter]|uniref:hypothetical protein n=1 Tax=unclassified Candidatus Frackibacter TaxID=2648818 RepID=UPI00079C8C48|nr:MULTISPECIES: hypothetical protein [unclassified Candidatus Frackibacter]KXS40325.1 MAG: hypothetical protein AWU54_2018 [Candidatus Frackibacter sp. T328-2]SDC45372.1 hypothetical protein SAMN04515661_11082 [Candidatus Frackibacter sp. WG11]SEM65207.1 hypothetical protein SAMN04488698_11083 [Candidatus Frackibacter sp. WG12]SFL67210.1 hypothetical protein SAMN04488699_1098 [Candidatus Frackibacter sp. WG13]
MLKTLKKKLVILWFLGIILIFSPILMHYKLNLNWESALSLPINLGIAIGTIWLAVIAYKEIRWVHRENRPRIDMKIELDENNHLVLKVWNTGELATRGTAYMIIEDQKRKQYASYSSITAISKFGDLTEEEFDNYWFAKLNLNLEVSSEPHVYRYPFRIHLENLCGEQNTSHFIRIEGVYTSAEYGEEQYKILRRYHMLSPNKNDSDWTIGRVGLNLIFRPHVGKDLTEVTPPTYQEYNRNLKN